MSKQEVEAILEHLACEIEDYYHPPRSAMNQEDQGPIHSPLEQSLTRDGKTVHVEIYSNGMGGWILEVVDEHGNSTVWDDPFQSDQAAMDELKRTIEEEGMDALIGEPSASSKSSAGFSPMQMMAPLLDEEMDELDSFLLSDATSDETMMLDCLDGYLTSIVTGPVTLMPSEWLPRVWGPTARDEPAFETMEQAERIVGLIMRHMNGIIWSMQHDPDAFEPIFDTATYQNDPHEYVDGEMWAYGYMSGIELQRKNWDAFYDEPNSAEILRPLYLLGATDVAHEEEALTETPAQREELSMRITASVARIYRFWQPYRQAVAERTTATTYQRENPKIGRNDPCPCGSGKKFKKCCGAPAVLH